MGQYILLTTSDNSYSVKNIWLVTILVTSLALIAINALLKAVAIQISGHLDQTQAVRIVNLPAAHKDQWLVSS